MRLVGMNKAMLGIGAVLLLIFAVLSFYFYRQYRKSQSELKNLSQRSQNESKYLVSLVSKLIELPAGETPTVGTVADKSELPNQPFYKNAQNGDKILLYDKAKKAILYRPRTNKIIEVSPFYVNPSPVSSASAIITPSGKIIFNTVTPAEPTAKKISVAIYNGTKTAGLATSTENEIEAKVASIEVVDKANSNNDYTKTIIIDLSNKNKKTAEEIVKILGGTIESKVPEGERIPEADILVIIGK